MVLEVAGCDQRIYVSSSEFNEHALLIIITNLGEVYFSIRFLQTFHRRFANATQVCCVNELVEAGEHKKQTKQHPHTLTSII